MGLDPISLDTTTMSISIAETLPKITPVTIGCASATSTQVIRKKISLSQNSVSNSRFPGTKSLIFTSQFLPSLLKYSIEPTSAEHSLHDYIQVDQPMIIKWLHSGSTKSRPTGHRRGRPRGLLVNSRGIKFCFRFIADVAVAVHHAQSSCYHGRIDRRDLGVAVLRTIITVLRQTQPQFSSLLDVLIFHAFCMSCCY